MPYPIKKRKGKLVYQRGKKKKKIFSAYNKLRDKARKWQVNTKGKKKYVKYKGKDDKIGKGFGRYHHTADGRKIKGKVGRPRKR